MTKYRDLPTKEGRPYVTSTDQIPVEFESETEEEEFWETAYFADGVLEEGQEIEDEVDRVLGIERLSLLEKLVQELTRILADDYVASSSSQVHVPQVLKQYANDSLVQHVDFYQQTQRGREFIYFGGFQKFRQINLFWDEHSDVQVEHLIAAQVVKAEKPSGGSSNW